MLIENNHIEFKAELNDKLEKEVVAFLNSNEGGVIYIGVDDFGHPVYLENIDILQTFLLTTFIIAEIIKNK